MTLGSLFTGIGGLDLGLERAGLGPVVYQAESDAHCPFRTSKIAVAVDSFFFLLPTIKDVGIV